VEQADFGRNLKPALAAKLLVFSDFAFALAFWKVLFVFCILKVHPVWRKVDYCSRISKSAPRGIKSTSVFKSLLKVRSARHKVDFGF
jgi:hypothetical protein